MRVISRGSDPADASSEDDGRTRPVSKLTRLTTRSPNCLDRLVHVPVESSNGSPLPYAVRKGDPERRRQR